VNTYIRLSKMEAEETIQEAHPYFREQGDDEESDEKVLELLQGGARAPHFGQ